MFAPIGEVIVRQDNRIHLNGHLRFLSVFDGMVAAVSASRGASVAWLFPEALLHWEGGGGGGQLCLAADDAGLPEVPFELPSGLGPGWSGSL